MTPPEPPCTGAVPSPQEAWRADRREAVRRHHPDRGGDADALQAALEEVDRRHGRGPGRARTPMTVRHTRRARWRSRWRRLQARVPGNRRDPSRWIDI